MNPRYPPPPHSKESCSLSPNEALHTQLQVEYSENCPHSFQIKTWNPCRKQNKFLLCCSPPLQACPWVSLAIETKLHSGLTQQPGTQAYSLNLLFCTITMNWCFWTVVLEKTLKSLLDSKEIQPVHPKGNQPWIFTGRTDAEAEAPVLCPSDAKNWLIGKDPDSGKDQGWEKGLTEDEMVGWHHWLDGHEFEQAPGDSERQGSLHAAVHEFSLSDWTTMTISTSSL